MEMVFGPTPGSLDDDEVVAAYPWPEDRRWVRAMMVTTLDGASKGPDGLSGSISGDADRQVFDAVRTGAEVVLIGSATMREEEYAALPAPGPRLAIVSGSLDLPWDLDAFDPAETGGADHLPLVLTGPDPDAEALAAAEGHAEVVRLPDTEAATILDALEERGLRRVVCEGGPSLLEAIVGAGLLDEADITVSPTFAGAGRGPGEPTLDEVHTLRLVHLLSADGFVMGRYVRGDA